MAENKESVETVRHNLQLDENLRQYKQGWMIQKIGWVVLYLGLILALAGVFGAGPVSYKTKSQNGISVKYERMDQIKYAVLELDGSISIIPKEAAS